MEIICYGDSNTYGWDPRDLLGTPYPNPWPSVLAGKTGFVCHNLGEPGRTLPQTQFEKALFLKQCSHYPNAKWILLFLGSNDILRGEAFACSERMENLLRLIQQNTGLKICIFSLPEILIPSFEGKAAQVNAGYEYLAEQYQTAFFDVYKLDLPLTYDGVHLAESAHRILGEQAAGVFQQR